MNQLIKICLLSLMVLSSQHAGADIISDSYSTGDTLTAATLGNIKAAVNGNDANVTALSKQVNALELLVAQQEMLMSQQIAAIQTLLACLDPSSNASKIVFKGCNIHLQNGNNSSDSGNALGNLIIGYDENVGVFSRTGSHNLIIGPEHAYDNNSGIVAGNSAVTFEVGDGRIVLDADNDISVISQIGDINLTTLAGDMALTSAAGKFTNTSTQSIELKSGGSSLKLDPGAIDLGAAGTLDLSGALTKINNGATPAASVGDIVVVTGFGYLGTPLTLTGTITNVSNATLLTP